MIGTKITITDELAVAVGRLVERECPGCGAAVTIAYDDDYPEEMWLVKLDVGYGSSTYLINDQTGEVELAGLGAGAAL